VVADSPAIPIDPDADIQFDRSRLDVAGTHVLLPIPENLGDTPRTFVDAQVWDATSNSFMAPVRINGSPFAWTAGPGDTYVVLAPEAVAQDDPRVQVVRWSTVPDFETTVFAADPDGSTVVVGGATAAWRIDRATGKDQGLPFGGDAAAFSPDGKLLVLASRTDEVDGVKRPSMLRVLDAPTATPIRDLDIDLAPTGVAIDPTGTVAAVIGETGSGKGALGALELVDLATGDALPVTSIKNRFLSVTFASDGGHTVATTLDDAGKVQRWDLDPASWRALACAIAGRNLSLAEWTRYVGTESYRETCPGLPVPTTRDP
jgi:WD40 repeat protein